MECLLTLSKLIQKYRYWWAQHNFAAIWVEIPDHQTQKLGDAEQAVLASQYWALTDCPGLPVRRRELRHVRWNARRTSGRDTLFGHPQATPPGQPRLQCWVLEGAGSRQEPEVGAQEKEEGGRGGRKVAHPRKEWPEGKEVYETGHQYQKRRLFLGWGGQVLGQYWRGTVQARQVRLIFCVFGVAREGSMKQSRQIPWKLVCGYPQVNPNCI